MRKTGSCRVKLLPLQEKSKKKTKSKAITSIVKKRATHNVAYKHRFQITGRQRLLVYKMEGNQSLFSFQIEFTSFGVLQMFQLVCSKTRQVLGEITLIEVLSRFKCLQPLKKKGFGGSPLKLKKRAKKKKLKTAPS